MDDSIWLEFDKSLGGEWHQVEIYVLIDPVVAYLEAVKPLPLVAPHYEELALSAERETLLGHDVADFAYTSAIVNCRYEPTEKAYLAAQFGHRLNEWQLFDDVETAKQFRDISNVRVKEHAPFFVYAIVVVASGIQ